MEPCKTGIVALRHRKESNEIQIVHFCGFWHSPLTQVDFDTLDAELRTDPEFGLQGGDFKLMEAWPELVDHYNTDATPNHKYQKEVT